MSEKHAPWLRWTEWSSIDKSPVHLTIVSPEKRYSYTCLFSMHNTCNRISIVPLQLCITFTLMRYHFPLLEVFRFLCYEYKRTLIWLSKTYATYPFRVHIVKKSSAQSMEHTVLWWCITCWSHFIWRRINTFNCDSFLGEFHNSMTRY